MDVIRFIHFGGPTAWSRNAGGPIEFGPLAAKNLEKRAAF